MVQGKPVSSVSKHQMYLVAFSISLSLSPIYFQSQQSAKSDDGTSKSAKSEWEGTGMESIEMIGEALGQDAISHMEEDGTISAVGKSAKSESIGEWSKSAKSDDGSAKSAKSEWEGIGEWSKVSLCSC